MSRAGSASWRASTRRTDEERRHSDEVGALLVSRLTEIGRSDLIARLDEQYGLTSLLFASEPLPSDVSGLVIEFLNLGQPAAVFVVPAGESLVALPELAGAK